jgi:hypothetical protein
LEEAKITQYIKNFLPFNCQISFKDSRKNIILVKKKFFTTNINLHPVFLKADDGIIHDIINFILRKNKESLARSKKNIAAFYNSNYKPKKIKIRKSFNAIDIFSLLTELLEPLKIKYGSVDFSVLKISWGKNYKNQRRSIRFGSFDRRHNLIRIHPKLDSEVIPLFFIKSVILHETAHFIAFKLHENLKPHGKKFHEILKSIDPYLKEGMIWEKNNKDIFFSGRCFP